MKHKVGKKKKKSWYGMEMEERERSLFFEYSL